MSSVYFDQPLTVLTVDPTAEDEMGNAELRPTLATDIMGNVQQTEPTEVLVGRDTAVSTWKVFLPPETVIDREDQIVEGDRTFEVMGTPYRVSGLSGSDHVEVRLRLVEG